MAKPTEVWLSGMLCGALQQNSHVKKAVAELAPNPAMGGALEPTNATYVETFLGAFRVTVEAVEERA